MIRSAANLCAAFLSVFCSCAPSEQPPPVWEQLPQLHARNVTAFLVDDRSSNQLIAALSDGRIFRSSDAGLSWTTSRSLPVGSRTEQFVQHPEKKSTLFAATTQGLFRTLADDSPWEHVYLPLAATDPHTCRAVAIDLWNTQRIYAGTDGRGVLVSTDGGFAWHPSGDSSLLHSSITDIQVAATRPDIVYATGTPFGVAQSSDGGNTWKVLGSEIQTIGAKCIHICIHRSIDQLVLVATDAGSIFKSTNGGKGWSPTRKARAWASVNSLASGTGNPNIVLAGTEAEVLLSTDFGSTWSTVSRSLAPTPVTVTVPPNEPPTSFFTWGSGIGLLKTIDGGETWREVGRGLGDASVDIVKSDQLGQFIFVVVGNALLRFDQVNSSWQFAGTGLVGVPPMSITLPRQLAPLAYTTTRAGVFQNAGSGLEWIQTFPSLRIVPTLVEPHPWLETRLFASSDRGLYVSTNSGESWSEVKPRGRISHVAQFLFHQKDAGVILGAAREKGVIRSSDGGLTWQETRSAVHLSNITALSQDDQDARIIYGWSDRAECTRSRDAGLTWDPFAQPWNVRDTVLLAIDRENPTDLVALVNGRTLLHSASGGTGWSTVSTVKFPASPSCIDWNLRSRFVSVGTRDTGVWRIRL